MAYEVAWGLAWDHMLVDRRMCSGGIGLHHWVAGVDIVGSLGFAGDR